MQGYYGTRLNSTAIDRNELHETSAQSHGVCNDSMRSVYPYITARTHTPECFDLLSLYLGIW